MLKTTRDRNLDKVVKPLTGADTAQEDSALRAATLGGTKSVRVGYRSFDRQWVLADNRVLDMARPPLWDARIRGQVFVIEQHSKPVTSGPGVVFTSLLPELNYFRGSEGGRALPFLHPNGRPNLANGILATLGTAIGKDDLQSEDILAYVAGVVSHSGFTSTFSKELTTPGIRVPMTADKELFDRAIALGRELVWLHSYGEAMVDANAGRPAKDVRFPAGHIRQPLSKSPVTDLPEDMRFVLDESLPDGTTGTVWLGEGSWGPVARDVYDYSVGGKNILKSWFNYRKRNPGGKKTSPLDDITVQTWPSEWTTEFTDLLTVLTRVVDLQEDQEKLLNEILAGPLVSRDDLSSGTAWPSTAAARKPDYSRLGDPGLF